MRANFGRILLIAALSGLLLAACGSPPRTSVRRPTPPKVSYHTRTPSTTTPAKAKNTPGTSTTTTTSSTAVITAAVLSALVRYVQAREDQDGADQSTPSSWVQSISSVVTPSLLATLQKSNNTAVGPWELGHQHKLIVAADVSHCAWDLGVESHTATAGAVTCALRDVTESAATHQTIPPSQIPFGWPFNGTQSSGVSLKFVKQGGTWLISQDVSGRGD